MVKATTAYVCQECGFSQPKWAGRCEACGGWNTMIEEVVASAETLRETKGKRGRKLAFVPLAGESPPLARRQTGIAEFDRVTGGGLVPGAALLIAGDPGIGKSTLLLQVAARLSDAAECVYISGEEAVDQLRLRADRLGIRAASLHLAAATSVGDIAATLDRPDGPEVIIIDSVHTLFVDAIESTPGSVAQVRAASQVLIRLAKRRGFVLLLVGHVTKEGMIAGPKVLEHMVDPVLSFEGARGPQFRILRATKNRFGATDEIGVFEMSDAGLREVTNPSALFLADRGHDTPGSAVFAGLEGTRPLLCEVQALIAPSALGTPRRAVVGWDAGRLAMILAVLESRAGLALGAFDVFLNIAGGLRVSEPAADLAVAAALASASLQRPLPPETVVFGEIGLGGEVRAVARPDARLKEAAKLGFLHAVVPVQKRGGAGGGLTLHEVAHAADLLARVRAGARSDRRERRVGHA